MHAGRLLSIMALGLAVPECQATDPGLQGKTWYEAYKDSVSQSIVSRLPSEGPGKATVLVAEYFQWPRETAGRFFYDFNIQVHRFDCPRAQKQIVSLDFYRHNQEKPIWTFKGDGTWIASSNRDPFRDIACDPEKAREAVKTAGTHHAMLAAYREDPSIAGVRSLEARRRSELDAKWDPVFSAANREVIPETSLAVVRSSSHWHGYRHGSTTLVADVHGVTMAGDGTKRRMSWAAFGAGPTTYIDLPNREDLSVWTTSHEKQPPVDFLLSFSEFDCSIPGMARTLARAGYARYRGEWKPVLAKRTPDAEWPREARSTTRQLWPLACKGAEQSPTHSTESGFDGMWNAHWQHQK